MMRRTTWIILAIFIALLAVAWYMQRSQEDAVEPTPTPASIDLFDFEGTQVTSLSLSDDQGNIMVISRNEGGMWELVEPPLPQTDVGAVDAAVTSLASTRVVSTLTSIPPLDAMGLDPPVYKLLIVLDDGEQLIVNVGKAAPTGRGYYLLTSDRSVFVVSKSGIDALVTLLENPPILATPQP
jgi:hypothetical protein